jgi:type VI secretion system secreted protein VgrG
MAAQGASTGFTFTIQGVSATLRVSRWEATEAISELFEVELSLTSEDRDIAFADAVGKPALLKIETEGSEPRLFHGIVSRFRHGEDGPQQSAYSATIVPGIFRLRLRHDARIFQAMTVPAIIDKVLSGAGVKDHRAMLTGSYAPREYCVQYRESDLAFISRLMEEEGIYYFFEHSEDKDVLVLADAPGAPAPIKGTDTLPYKGFGAMTEAQGVSRFSSSEEVRSGKVTLTDYNFKKPALSLLSSASGTLDTDLEVYDYPGEYELPGDGTTLSKVRLEEQQARRAVAEGQSTCFRLTPGYLFSLSDAGRDADNRRYLIVGVRHRGSLGWRESDAGGPPSGASQGEGYANTFHVIPSDVPFRPERRTPRPTIKGVQTAIVTGPGGEEIYVDEHGRVKVHFHWDRKGKSDDSSSCWIRVSQLWAGAGWGAMWSPRIGHEVIVDFIEGDPDRPIIVGRVYHGANVPPYPLPGEKTKSTIKSDSSKGGGGNNELRFEDKKGSEEVWLHGQKDWNIKIEHDKGQIIGHDEALDVGHDRTKHVAHDQSETVDHDKKIQVGNDHTENIVGNATIHVGRDHTENIDGKESLTIGKTRDVTVASDQTTTIGGNHTITVSQSHSETISITMTQNVGAASSENVGAAKDVNVGAAYSVNVGAAMSTTVGAVMSTTVGADESTDVGGSQSINVGGDRNIGVGGNQVTNVGAAKAVIAGKEVSIQCGDASILIEKNGNITVSGKQIAIKGTGPIDIEGSKIQVKSDGTVKVEGSGAVTIKGSNVGIN